MGNYTSEFIVPEREAVSKHTHPSQPNWITLHAVATECKYNIHVYKFISIAEVERLWARFRQMKCNSDGEVTESNIAQLRIHSDAFARNIMKRMLATYGREKKITFENYIRALKWVETADMDKKLRAIHRLLNNAQPVPRAMFVKILERIYINPEDRKDLDRVSQTFFDMMDPDNKGYIDEESFARVMFNVPSETLEQVIDFQILPNYMKERLHQNLPEFFTPKETLTVPGQGDKSLIIKY
ncbi:hypothetical protein KUTeg_004524 [Tegillarca granosa]|uniref:EF-hand domain-containing protein n=1 Tax=Tegillarca granosa TaxID=220873 RepID=A0ABQ9FQA7_TEGGR|nr:hypothetical protein KUTeg_004524 [Tegillarca granosa]